MAKVAMTCVPVTKNNKALIIAIKDLNTNPKHSLTKTMNEIVDYYIQGNNLTLDVSTAPAAVEADVEVAAEEVEA
jgi:hypothetical protein